MHNALLSTTLALVLALCVLVVYHKRSLLSETALVLALLGFSAALALDWCAIASPESALQLKRLSLVANGLAVWNLVAFSLSFARSYESVPLPRFQLVLLALLIAMPLVPAIIPAEDLLQPAPADRSWIIPLTPLGFVLLTGTMAGLILALYNLEATLANATHAKRWRIKFFVLGCMALATSQVLSDTPSLLFRALDLSLCPTREIGLLLAALLIGFSLLTRGGQVKIVFSKRLAYRSLVVFCAGLYFMAIGLLGQSGGALATRFSSPITLGLALVSGFFVLAVLLSETARRTIGVGLRKYFYKDKYDFRQQWLSFTQRLADAQQPESLQHAVLEGFCETFGIAQSALYLRCPGEESFAVVSQMELDLPYTPISRTHPCCPDPAQARFAVKDLRSQSPCPLLPQASFSVPLVLDAALEGFVLLGRPFNQNEVYDEEDFELMEAMAHQALLAVRNLTLARDLAVAREMEIMGKISAFMLHDLKNLVYPLSLMHDNANHYIGNPEFQQDMLKTLGNTVARMKNLITQFTALPSRDSLRRATVDLQELVKESAKAVPDAKVTLHGDAIPVEVDREEMGKVLVNLLRNAHEASRGEAPVEVEVGGCPQPYVAVRDTGCGMSQTFVRSNLFVPFSTTKQNGMGIGLYQSKHIVEAHNGRLEVVSDPGHGSTFTVLLPSLRQGEAP